MKKVLVGILVLLMVMCMVGCGSDVSCTVTKKTGETVTISAEEIIDIATSDDITFSREYSSAAISGTGKITKIESGAIGSYTTGVSYYVVTINDCVQVETRAEVFTDFKVGDKVKFSGSIYKGFIYLEVDLTGESISNPQPNIFHAD